MLKARIITALILLFGLLAALFLLPKQGWLVFCALICAGAAWEWGGLAAFPVAVRWIFAVSMGLACVLAGAAVGLGGGAALHAGVWLFYVPSALFWLCVIPLWLSRKWALRHRVIAAMVGFVVLVPPSLALAHLRLMGPWVLLAVMAAVWVADISAYFAGRAFGRHKLAPGISPGKTWEGAAGAALGVLAFGGIVAFAVAENTSAALVAALVPALIGFTAVSIIGDLFESLLKRQAGVKDSGTILPGHGGILDRIDSLTSTLPLAGLAALWLATR